MLRVQLRDITPPIWRTIVVPAEYTLAQLHRTLQLVFAWQDYHLHEFEVGDRRFAEPDIDEELEASIEPTTVRLSALGLAPGAVFLYRYDFGDDWEHDIRVEQVNTVADPEAPRLPWLLDGARASPPEDCGGPGGFEAFLAALTAPDSEEGRECRRWVGEAYDPARFDRWQVGRMLTLAALYGAI